MQRSEIVSRAYAQKKLRGACEVCGSSNWGISEELSHLTFSEADEDGKLVGMTNAPVAVMTCSVCGNMRIHSLKILAGE